ncbi:CBO0543 family protein [Cytobacillus dafuensis]|uniref:CBO0543 family protein n=1 Tax=Cytobacillus dafuensis TaxID=1742359 RepID=UPI0007104007|nr:CBO0543 family protein [Cytobacillus dafuensis]
MNIVKPSKGSNLQPLQKKYFRIVNKTTLPILLLAIIAATYLDLFFVGKGLYSFPIRPMPEVFSINIAFTLIALPLFIITFLFVCSKINLWQKIVFIIILSLMMSSIEKAAESFGFFYHHESWKHIFSFFGYIIYLSIISIIYKFYNRW